MKIELKKDQSKIFILGAGASVDYGLPVWKELTILIKDFLTKPENSENQYKKEILEWIELVGENNQYKTLDECIYYETSSEQYKDSGQDIEFEIFKILKIIFDELYNKGKSWIQKLNEKIRKKEGIDWNQIFFINYNYDKVLSDNILDFEYLSKTDRLRIYRERIGFLEGIKNYNTYNKLPCLYPHGLFEYQENSFLNEMSDTINSHDGSLLESVSCFHSKKHQISFPQNVSEINLYILGLGGGLESNLQNITFDDISKIKNIHITIKKHESISDIQYKNCKKEILEFLIEKYKILQQSIFVYNDCIELIEKCFQEDF